MSVQLYFNILFNSLNTYICTRRTSLFNLENICVAHKTVPLVRAPSGRFVEWSIVTPRGAQPCRLLNGTFCSPFLALCIACWIQEEGWKYFCKFVFVCFTYKANFMNKPSIYGKVGQLSQRKRVRCWSIYIISLCFVAYGTVPSWARLRTRSPMSWNGESCWQVTDQGLTNSSNNKSMCSIPGGHRRRIYTEEQVVAAIWGTEFIQFLATLAVVHQDDKKKGINCTRMIRRNG